MVLAVLVVLALLVLLAVVAAALAVAVVVVLLQHIHWDLYMSNSIQQYNHICIDTCMSNILTHTDIPLLFNVCTDHTSKWLATV